MDSTRRPSTIDVTTRARHWRWSSLSSTNASLVDLPIFLGPLVVTRVARGTLSSFGLTRTSTSSSYRSEAVLRFVISRIATLGLVAAMTWCSKTIAMTQRTSRTFPTLVIHMRFQKECHQIPTRHSPSLLVFQISKLKNSKFFKYWDRNRPLRSLMTLLILNQIWHLARSITNE